MNTEEVILKTVRLMHPAEPELTLPQALQVLTANTSSDKSNGYIARYTQEVLAAPANLTNEGFTDIYGSGADRDRIDQILMEALLRLSVDPASRKQQTEFNKSLKGLDSTLRSEQGIIFRFGHMDFVEGEPDSGNMETRPIVVPSSIQVQRSYLSQKIETLRSPSSPVAVSPTPVETISVDFIFPNLESLNGPFREMYSMSQSLPVMTIESPLLTAAFINDTDFPKLYNRALTGNIEDKTARTIKAIHKDAFKSLDDAIELSRTDDPFVDIIFDRVKAEVREIESGSSLTQNPNLSGPELLDSAISRVSTAIGVVVKDLAIQTLSNNPGAILVRITFQRSNIPMLEKGQPVYLNKNGDPTYSAKDAYWLKKYSRTLLNPNIAKDRYLKKIDKNIDGWDDFSLQWGNIYGDNKDLRLNTTNSVESGVNITTGFKVATMNLVNSRNPLTQHVGRTNVQAMIMIETTDLDFIRNLSTAKSEIEQEAKEGLIKRNSAIIKHPLLNLLGVNRVSITDISVQASQDNPNLRTVTLVLVENALMIDEVESLALESGYLPTRALEEFWEFSRKVLNYIRKMAISNKLHKWTSELQDPEKATFDVIYNLFIGARTLVELRGSSNRKLPGILSYPATSSLNPFRSYLVKSSLIRGGIRSFISRRKVLEGTSKTAKDDAYWACARVVRKFALDPNFTEYVIEERLDASKVQVPIFKSLGYEVVHKPHSSKSKAGVSFGGQYTVHSAEIPKKLMDSMLEELQQSKSKDIQIIRSVVSSIVKSSMFENLVDLPAMVGSGDPTIRFTPRDIELADSADGPQTEKRKALSTYSDLILPTYNELFEGKVDSAGVPIWKKFAPTYSDLGVRPPVNLTTAFMDPTDAYALCAHKEVDLVSPGSFFYRPRVKAHMEEMATELSTKSDDDAFATVVTLPIGIRDIPIAELGKDPDAILEDISASNIQDWIKTQENNELDLWRAVNEELFGDKGATKVDNKFKIINVISAEGKPIISYVRGANGKLKLMNSVGSRNVFRSTDNAPAFDPTSQEYLNKIVASGLTHTSDHTSNMDKAFPAVRIYMVEEDRKHRSLFDDLYSTSAILSVSVTKDMNDADVAIMKLSNTSGYLSQDMFIPKRSNDRFDDAGEPFLSKFKIQHGTHIVVKMGYASRPEDLKTVFTGAVAQIQGGDVITLIAQGFKTELLNEVGFFNEAFTWEETDRPHLRNVINKTLLLNGDCPHLGRNYTLDDPHSKESEDLIRSLYGHDSGMTNNWWSPIDRIAEKIGGKTVSDIGKNIYYDSNTFFYPEFAIPTMPAMDAIQEAVKYIPNFIAEVVPYGVDATLFVGDPSIPYQYRESTHNEDKAFQMASRSDQDEAGLVGAGPFQQLIADFHDSPEHTQYLETIGNIGGIFNTVLYDPDTLFDNTGLEAFTDDQNSRDISGELTSQESSGFAGLRRLTFASFFGFNPIVQTWPTGLQSTWSDLSSALLSPWYNKELDGFFTSGYTANYWNAVSYLRDEGWFRRWTHDGVDESLRTRNTVTNGTMARVMNPALLTSGDSNIALSSIKKKLITFSLQIQILSSEIANLESIGAGGTVTELPVDINDASTASEIDGAIKSRRDRIASLESNISELRLMQTKFESNAVPTTETVKDLSIAARKVQNGSAKESTLIIDFMYDHSIHYRAYMMHLMEFMQKKPTAEVAFRRSPSMFGAEMKPGYKTFRDYHMVTSEQDIIENNITASDSEMWTAAVLKAPAVAEIEGVLDAAFNAWEYAKGTYDPSQSGNLVTLDPSQDYILWPNQDSVPGAGDREGQTFRGVSPRSEDILKMFHEPNATTPHAAATVLTRRLCEGMSLMYRGNLVLVGKVMKPYDVISIRDAHTHVLGNIMIERVTHNFDPQHGWTTTVVPRALTYHNSHINYQTSSIWADMWNVAMSDDVNDYLLYISLAAMAAASAVALIASGGTATPGVVAAWASRMAAQAAVRGTSLAAGGRIARLTAGIGSRLSSVGGALARVPGKAAGYYGAHTVLRAGDREIGHFMSQWYNNSLAQNVGGVKFPVLVQSLTYQGRPYIAGFKVNEDDFNTEFFKQLQLIFTEFGDWIGGGFTDGRAIFDYERLTKQTWEK